MEEEWRPVVGYEGLYEISNLGRVKSLDHYVPVTRKTDSYTYQLHVKEKILKQGRRQDGYADVSLSKQGVTTLHCVHRLLAEAWIPNPNNLKYVNHKDLDKTNNSLDNLEWVSNSENIVHAINRYSNNKQCRPVYCAETNEVYPSLGQCEKALGLKAGYARRIIDGITKSNYHLSFATEPQVESDKDSIDAKCGWTFEFKGKGKRLHPIRAIKCVDNQETYATLKEASEATRCSGDGIRESIRSKRPCNGLVFYYLDEAPEDENAYREMCFASYHRKKENPL